MWDYIPLDIMALIKGEVLAMLLAKNSINQPNGEWLFNGYRVSGLQGEESYGGEWW